MISTLAVTMLMAATTRSPMPGTGVDAAFLAAVNAERVSRGLAPVRLSAALEALAAERAAEIGASETLAFDPMTSEDALARAKAGGYPALVVQELVAVQEGDPREIVSAWCRALDGAQSFLRHETRDIGVGEGRLEEQPVYVLISGVPPSADPDKKRLPGIAPREWLTADLFDLANRRRNEAGYPSFDRSDSLDAEAQKLAESLLNAPGDSVEGVRPARGGGQILYFKATGRWRVADARAPIDAWFKRQRDISLTPGPAFAGAGLASRGEDEKLVAVWTVAIRSRRAS
jgi:hypothetical protein